MNKLIDNVEEGMQAYWMQRLRQEGYGKWVGKGRRIKENKRGRLRKGRGRVGKERVRERSSYLFPGLRELVMKEKR